MSYEESFDQRLKRAMEARKLSVAALVAACGGAFSARTVFRWRSGASVPGAEALPLLTRALKVSSDWLLGGSDDGGPDVSVPTTIRESS